MRGALDGALAVKPATAGTRPAAMRGQWLPAATVAALHLLAGLASLLVPAAAAAVPSWQRALLILPAAVPWWLAMAVLAVATASRQIGAAEPAPAPSETAGAGDAEQAAAPPGPLLAARLLPVALLTVLHGLLAALLLAWPLQWALAAPSLGSYLATASAVLLIVLAPLPVWPAPFLAALPRHARGLVGLRPLHRQRRALRAARALVSSDAGGERGLGVQWLYSACLLLPVVALLADGLRGAALSALLLPAALAVALLQRWVQQRVHAGLDAAGALARPDAAAPPGAGATLPATARQRALRLREAVRQGEVELALALLAAGADATEPPWPDEPDQRDAVIIAASLNDARPLRAMIAAGIDVNHRCQGVTPLLAATRDAYYAGRVEIVLTLLANGARTDVQDEQGTTPLHHAALCADVSVALMLLEAGAAIDATDGDGHTPLARAALAGNVAMTELLLRHRAALEPAGGLPVLCAAAAATDDEPAVLSRLLAARADTAVRGADRRTPLHHAVAAGHLAITRCLLAAGADVDAVDSQGQTPLHLACVQADADNPLVQALLAAGARMDCPDAEGVTPAMLSRARRRDRDRADGGLDDAGESAVPVPARAPDRAAVGTPEPWSLSPQERAALALAASVEGHLAGLAQALALPLPAAVRLPDGRDLIDAALAAWPASRSLLAALPSCGVSLAGGGRLAQLLQAVSAVPDRGSATGTTGEGGPGAEDLALAWLAAGADPHAAGPLPTPALPASGATAADGSTEGSIDGPAGQAAAFPAAEPQPRNGGAATRPLHLAAQLGFRRLAAALLELGVDAGQADCGGRTPLHWLLLRMAAGAGPAGGPTAAAAEPGPEAAAAAAPAGEMEGFLRLLLRHGADPAAACACSETPQGLAADAGLAALRPWLHWPGWRLPGRRLAAHDLVAAARQGDAGAVARLLDLGLPVDARDDSGGTALLHAAGHGHLDTVDLLLARGAAVDARARSGNTPLVAAILGGHPDAVARLLAQGAVVDRVLAHGATALLVGAACGALEACQQLLAAGADVGHGDAAGNRALHAAASYALGSADGERVRQLLRTLLAAGADIDARNRQGLTALHVACGAAAASRPDQRGIDAALDILLARAGAVQALDEDGRSALHYAAAHGLLQAARRLLARGADVAIADSQGWSPLDLAAHYGHTEVLQLLRTTSAPPNLLLRPG